jgi:N-acetylglucosamine malate deacetylase 2
MKSIARPKPSVLCVFAHPDDESFSCAGTIARYVPEGVAFHILSFTPGQAAKRPESIESAGEMALLREFELRAAAGVLGIASVNVLDYEDGRLDQATLEDLISHVKDALDRTQADTIISFGPHGLTEHDDHKAAHRAALQAAEEYGRNLTVFLIALDPGHTNGVRGPEARPTHRIDVSAYREQKLAALACHASQEDARKLFLSIARKERDEERYHQVFPPAEQGTTRRELFEELDGPPARLENAATNRAKAS